MARGTLVVIIRLLVGGGGFLTATALAAELPKPIVVAIAGPLVGRFASTGKQIEAGARLALAELNAAGGLLGRSLEAISVDDSCSASEAWTVAQRLVKEDVAVVIGHSCAGAASTAASIYASAGRLMITPAARYPRLTEMKPPGAIFRLAGRDDKQGQVIAQAIAAIFVKQRIALLHDYTGYGKGLALEIDRALRAVHITPVLLLPFTAGEADYAGIVQRLRAAQADAVFIGGNLTEFAIIAKALRAAKFDAALFGGDVLKSNGFVKLAGAAGEGVQIAFPPDLREWASPSVLAKFRAASIEPEGAALAAYAAVEVWAEAARHENALTAQAVGRFLHSASFDTALGRVSFDAKGDASLPSFAIYRLHDGKFSQTAPIPASITDLGTRP